MKKSEFKSFFKPYAKNVDKANNSFFWRLSDELIAEIIKNNIPENLTSKNVILDAGGGTGRWIGELSKIYKSDFILYDLSEDMLKKAEENIAKTKITSRVKIINGNLTDMSEVKSNSVDYIVSIYSPISFVEEKEKVAKELYRILKKGGGIIIMGHGYFNAIYSKINNYMAGAIELKDMEKSYTVKWGEHVPKLNTFSKESMEKLLTGAGFEIVRTYGVPVFVQPGPEDFDPENVKISRISTGLSKRATFKEVIELEMKYNSMPAVANRGMNIFSVGKKK